MQELLALTSDHIFKQVFGQPECKGPLISFLNALFEGEYHIESLTIINTEISKILEDDKTKRLDVQAITDKEDYLDIEIQVWNTGEIPERSVVYASEGFNRFIKTNESYEKHKSIGIWILDENITDRTDAIGKTYMMYEASKNDGVEKYADNLRIITIELQKFHPRSENNMKILTAWLAFIKNPYILKEDYLKSWLEDKDVADAVKRLEYVSCSEDTRTMEDERRSQNDRNSEITTVREEERAKAEAEKLKEKQESAKSLLVAGVSTEIVATSLRLSIEEVETIKNKMQ